MMAADLLAQHWNCADVDVLASGEDPGGRALPSNAWMALRRLGWTTAPAGGVKANDRIVRMAQEQAGRVLRAAKWRADLTAGVLTTWPGAADRRTAEEWDAVRGAVPGGQFLPSNVIKSRTRQVTAFVRKTGRMPLDVFELDGGGDVSGGDQDPAVSREFGRFPEPAGDHAGVAADRTDRR